MDVDELLESVDIVEFISQYVDLTEQGDEWWGISPFTFPPERTPSFSVRKESNRFYDFSSGIGGTAITFIKYLRKCNTHEAIEIVSKFAGITDTGEISPKKKMSTTLVCKKFQKPRKTTKQSKGVVLRDDCMEQYERRLDKMQVWIDEGISIETLDKWQVRYDSFSNRLVYPIRNLEGKVVNVGGRTVSPDWKERGLRKYTYFYNWGSLDVVFGLYENMKEILRRREVILFEGCKSVLLASSWGIGNAGCLLTSHLNPNQMKILAKLGCRVVFALDKEIRIREDHNIQKLRNYVEVEYLWDKDDLLDEKDAPVDKGFEVFMKLYEGRMRYR